MIRIANEHKTAERDYELDRSVLSNEFYFMTYFCLLSLSTVSGVK